MADDKMILGLGGSDHDVHACLAIGDRIVVTIEEERLSRKKYGLGGNLLEARARKYCLEQAGREMGEGDRVLRDAILAAPAYAVYRSKAEEVDHHLCHAAASYLTSPFDEAAVVVIDNAGGRFRTPQGERLQATSWYKGEGRGLELLGRVGSSNWKDGPLFAGKPYQSGDGDHSIGHFYKQLTGSLGYRYPRGADRAGFYFPEDGITMGLASYGEPRFADELMDLFRLEEEGGYAVTLNDGRLYGLIDGWLERDSSFEMKAAIAASGQEVLTAVVCHVVQHALQAAGTTKLCMSGGVAMNSSMNGELLKRTAATEIHVPFAPADNGTGLGAVLLARAADPDSAIPVTTPYGGRSYAREEIDTAFRGLDRSRYETERLEEDDLRGAIVERVADGQVVALFRGGSETGRRALGHRSLLADPRRAAMRDHINADVKRREMFRPFAPSVLAERAADYFDTDQESPFMQVVFSVKPEAREMLGAVCHVDNSARIQTVRRDQEPFFYAVIEDFGARTGVYVLLNTSFNGPGEPIVETPWEALDALDRLSIDALCLEDVLVTRRPS